MRLQLTVEPGDFEIMIGHDSQRKQKAKLTVNWKINTEKYNHRKK